MEYLEVYGYIGLLIGSFLAATIVPFASEALFIALLANGFDPFVCLIIATIGNTAGGMTSYGLGYFLKWKWLTKYFGWKPSHLDRWHNKVDKHGAWWSLLCWAPVIGDVIAIVLGVLKVNLWRVLLGMIIGKLLRYGFLIYTYQLTQ